MIRAENYHRAIELLQLAANDDNWVGSRLVAAPLAIALLKNDEPEKAEQAFLKASEKLNHFSQAETAPYQGVETRHPGSIPSSLACFTKRPLVC
jgi:hypothetical protein